MRVQRRQVGMRPTVAGQNTITKPSLVTGLRVRGAGGGFDTAQDWGVVGEANARVAVTDDGRLQFGPGGAGILDTGVTRIAPVGIAAAGTLAQDGRRFDRLGFFNVKDYGAVGTGTDDRLAIQAAISACEVAGGGTVFFPRGDYGVDCTTIGLTVPNEKAITLQGEAPPVSIAVSPVRIRLIAGSAAPLISNVVGSGPRCRVTLRDLEFDGGNTTGRILFFVRTGNSRFENCRFFHQSPTAGVPGVECQGIWNSHIHQCYFSSMGNGLAQPAVRLTAVPGAANENINTLHISNSEFEANTGTDLELHGDSSTGMRATHVGITNCKMEDTSSRTFPLVRLRYTGDIMINSCTFYIGGANTAPCILSDDSGGAGMFTGCMFEKQTGSGTNYLIDQTGNFLACVGCYFANYSGSLTSAWHIGTGVGLAALARAQGAGNIYWDMAQAKRWVDDRSGGGGPISVS